MVDFSTLMTVDQIALVHQASGIAKDYLKGAKLNEMLLVGEALMIGRSTVLRSTGGEPKGAMYARTFADWKAQYGFASMPKSFIKDCMTVAERRTMTDEIVAGLRPEERANFGPAGLAKRVRQQLKQEASGEPPAPRLSAVAKLKAELAEKDRIIAHIEEEKASMDDDIAPQFVNWFSDDNYRTMVDEVIDVIVRSQPQRAKDFAKRLMARLEQVDWAAISEAQIKRGRVKQEKNDARRARAQERRAATIKADRDSFTAS
jgi:hypothetical protein